MTKLALPSQYPFVHCQAWFLGVGYYLSAVDMWQWMFLTELVFTQMSKAFDTHI